MSGSFGWRLATGQGGAGDHVLRTVYSSPPPGSTEGRDKTPLRHALLSHWYAMVN
ncbi:hypothetical protein [Cereibacter changlensis]|uniref:hypothetical protein n=1 Tax=Cereibacter changlensis TaxID=402884 RepID=UPI00145DAF93|nr:hypothetical protein [Cereibacter changlensis]